MRGFWEGLFSGGKYGKELRELQKKASQNPKNIRLQVRIGDLLEKMGKRAEALEVYHQASQEYGRSGFLIQAIAVNKLILRLDPAQTKIHANLAELYSQWGMAADQEREIRAAAEGLRGELGEKFPPIPLFSDLKKEELSRVMEKIQSRPFSKDSAVCVEGEPGNSIFIISRGRVDIIRRKADGEPVVINRLHEGDFFGEFAFFSDSRRTASVVAAEETEVLEITKPDLQQIVKEFPSVAQVLSKFYKERVLDTLLATSSLFQSLSPEERKQILERVTIEEFGEGAMVLEEGALGDSLYMIKQGEVEVFTSDAKMGPVTLARLKEGDFFGEISLLTGRPRSASVKVLQPAELVRLNKKDFDQIAASYPRMTKILEDSLHTRLENKLKALGVFQDNPAKEGMV